MRRRSVSSGSSTAKPRSGESDEGEPEAGHLLHQVGFEPREGALGGSVNPAVAGEDGHGGKLHRLRERLDAPVELVIADDPRIVPQRIEQADHERASRREAWLGALVNVADIDERPVRVFLLPAADLGGTTS
jgi:hypothetical protein